MNRKLNAAKDTELTFVRLDSMETLVGAGRAGCKHRFVAAIPALGYKIGDR